MTSRSEIAADQHHDRFMTAFDRGVALTAYGLLFISPFMLGAPALAAFGMAFVHRDEAHSTIRSHYRFQMRIFWTTVICMVLGVALAVGAGGLAIGAGYHWARSTFPEIGLPPGGVHLGANVQEEENWLLLAGAAFLVGGFFYVLGGSAYGFIKLLAGRPIRHRQA